MVPPGPKRGLDEAAVLTAAEAIIAERGLDRLSIRAVARRLELSPNAVYTYFAGRAALEMALVEQVLQRVLDEFPATYDDPRTGLHDMANRARAAWSARLGLVALVMTAPLTGPVAQAFGDRLIGQFTAAGLSRPDAERAAHTFQVHVLGLVALETADLRAGRESKYDPSQQFDWSLDRLLDGLFLLAS